MSAVDILDIAGTFVFAVAGAFQKGAKCDLGVSDNHDVTTLVRGKGSGACGGRVLTRRRTTYCVAAPITATGNECITCNFYRVNLVLVRLHLGSDQSP
jgi:hypothetical protein